MSFLKNVFNILTDKRKLEEPVIYKEFNEKTNLITNLTSLTDSERPNIDKQKVEKHLKLFSIGLTGEKNVLFELKNSMLPLLVLHDVYLEFEDYHAQLDFVIITHKFILVLEVKKLFGNIKVTDKGEFQRVITRNNKVVNKEGMYSPINQVERHVAILERLLKNQGGIEKCPIKYAVTFANPKTILDISENAPSDIQSNVIRHDQIKSFLKNKLEKKSPAFMSDQDLYGIADTILEYNQEKIFNMENYTLDKPQISQNNLINDTSVEDSHIENMNKNLKTLLTDFRLRRSKELDVKPYYIFTNKILESLLEKRPLTPEQLLEVEGIGRKKVEEFGNDLLFIIRSSHAVDNSQKSVHTEYSQVKSSKPLQKKKSNAQSEKVSIEDLRVNLTEFRTRRSKELNVKSFYIFTNKTLEAILEKRPDTIKELLKVEGIGQKKAEEFGQEIIDVIQNRR